MMITSALVLIGGCSVGEDLWPVSDSVAAKKYVQSTDPCALSAIKEGKNIVGYSTLAGQKKLKETTDYVYIERSQDLKAMVDKNSELYNYSSKVLNTDITKNQQSYDSVLGSSGWGTLLATSLFVSGATALGIRKYDTSTLSTDAEVATAVTTKEEEVTNKLTKINWSPVEVENEVAARVKATCLACGVTDEAKIAENIKIQVALALAETTLV